ncbi:MAG: hypothetical protein ACRC4T_05160 [Cetobacterium sp.]
MYSNDLRVLSTSYLNLEKEFYKKANQLIEHIEKLLLQSEFYRDYINKIRNNLKKYKSIKKIIIKKKLLKNNLKKKITPIRSFNHILIDGIRVLRI